LPNFVKKFFRKNLKNLLTTSSAHCIIGADPHLQIGAVWHLGAERAFAKSCPCYLCGYSLPNCPKWAYNIWYGWEAVCRRRHIRIL